MKKPGHAGRHDKPFPEAFNDPRPPPVALAAADRPQARSLVDGWIIGPLPGLDREYPVVRHARSPVEALRKSPPNPLLHTTERDDDGFNPDMNFPPQCGVANNTIFQLFPVTAKGFSTDQQDDFAFQIEIGARSQLDVWLPPPESYGPLVALAACLHHHKVVTTFLKRPTDRWPVHVDRVPNEQSEERPATDGYYRRHAGLWPNVDGVYMHLESPGDEHWDAGGFNFPVFFRDVQQVLAEHYGEGDMGMTEQEKEEFAALREQVARMGMTDQERADFEALKAEVARLRAEAEELKSVAARADSSAGKSDARWTGVGSRLKLPTPDPEPGEEGPEKMGWRFVDRVVESPEDQEMKQWLGGLRRRFSRGGPPPADAPDPVKKGFEAADTELQG